MHQPLSTLHLPNNTINKLENLGYNYVNDVEENLEWVLRKVQLPQWKDLTDAAKPKTALELLHEENNDENITTFIPELDSILVDQIHPGIITELTGLPGSGKTQTCLHLAVGVRGEAVYIHTNKNLNPERLREIAVKYLPDANVVMDKLFCIQATDPTELLASIQLLKSWLPEHEDVKLIIIDNISWPLKQLPFTERTNLFYSVFQNLRILANVHNFGVVLTNDLTTRINGDNTYLTSSFGDSFYHSINNRVLFTREGNFFNVKVLKSVQPQSQDLRLFQFG